MSGFALPPAAYIDSDEALRALIPQFAEEPFLAIDTESNSLYAYREQVCLLQMTTRRGDYIIDPLVVNVEALGSLMADPRIEKILHAAEYDIMGMKRDFGFQFANIFDTMMAARVCGFPQVGLGNLLAQFLGVEVDKRHQRDNWGERPLPPDSLRYAQMDTHFLPMLRNDLYDELRRQDCLREAREVFEELYYIEPASLDFDPDGYWNIGRSKGLNRRQMAILRELYLWRESAAEARNVPPFKVLGNGPMIELARRAPNQKEDMGRIKGISTRWLGRYGKAALAAIHSGRSAPLPSQPPRPRPAPPPVMERYTALREWRKDRANARGVESDVIVSKNVLWALAHEAPKSLDDMQRIPGLGPWRLSNYGAELLEVLQEIS